MAIFDLCLVADDVRIEIENKASIIGFYGRLPFVQIAVPRPDLPINRLTFLFISHGSVSADKYSVRLSVKDPNGRELMAEADAVNSDAVPGVMNTIINCLPFPLTGAGVYRVTVMVNGVEDFSSTLTILKANPSQ